MCSTDEESLSTVLAPPSEVPGGLSPSLMVSSAEVPHAVPMQAGTLTEIEDPFAGRDDQEVNAMEQRVKSLAPILEHQFKPQSCSTSNTASY